MSDAFDFARFARVPIVGILRGVGPAEMEAIGQACVEAGVSTLEVTLNSPGALASIRLLRERFGGEINIGAGTVNTVASVALAVEAGARFIVTPTTQTEVITVSRRLGVPVFPGACSPAEIVRAWELGAAMVKVFPASHLGPAYVRAVAGVVPEVKLLPTGGVTRANMGEFRAAGAAGFGIGSPLFPAALVGARDWAGLTEHMKGFVAGV